LQADADVAPDRARGAAGTERRTVKVGECLLRLVSAMLVEIDEKLDSDTKVSGYLTRSQQDFQTTACSIHTAPIHQAP